MKNLHKLHFVYLAFGGLLIVIIFSSNAAVDFSHGYASPGDGLCADCHIPNADAGSIEIIGLPAGNVLQANASYPLVIRLTRESNDFPEGGFQMSVTDGTNSVGTYTSIPSSTQVQLHQRCQGNGFDCAGGNTIEYLEHNQGLNILFGASNTISWNTTWKAPATAGPVTFVVAGVLTDGSGSQSDGDFSVSWQSPFLQVIVPVSVSITPSHVTCPNGDDGAAVATVTGGDGNYTYLWSNGSTDPDIINVPAGIYSLTVTDGVGFSKVAAVQLLQPTAFLTATSVTMPTCSTAPNGSINLTVSGATPPYGYQWSNGATTQDIFNLVAGTYTVTITDAMFCTRTVSATLTGPTITFSISPTNASCFGGNNGAIDISNPAGGLAPYSYFWSNGASSQDITGLTAGTYSVTVSDQNNCTNSVSLAVGQPPDIILNDTVTNATCAGLHNGAINLTPAGGTGDYTYLWSNDSVTQDITNLAAGIYAVTVADANGCTKTGSDTITQPAEIILSAAATNASCFGGSNGSIDLTTGGGTGNYSYLWSNDSVTQDITNLAAGIYAVTVADANGCTKTGSDTIAQPAEITLSAATTIVSCFGGSNGSIDLTPGGGTGNYTYLWSNDSVTQDITNLAAGIYAVTVADANGCTKTGSDTIAQPAEITLSASATNASCFGGSNGSIDLTPGGGTGNYTYLWSNGSMTQDIINLAAGIYAVTVADANGCTKTGSDTITQPTEINLSATATIVSCFGGSNGSIDLTPAGGTGDFTYLWSNSDTLQDIVGLEAGTYSVIVTDAVGCTKTLQKIVEQASALQTELEVIHISCFGGATGGVNVTVSGGTPGYTYSWSDGSTAQNLSNLTEGAYIVTVTDANDCFVVDTAIVVQAPPLSAQLIPSDVACYGDSTGSIAATVTGGAGINTFLWSNGATAQNINNLTSGTYSVLITDVSGCTLSASATVSQPESPVSASAEITGVSCFGGNDGMATMDVSGGSPPYSYSWSNGADLPALADLEAGAYSCVIADTNGCLLTISVEIPQPVDLTMTLDSTIAATSGMQDGAVYVTISGATPPYSHIWTDLMTGDSISTSEDLNGAAAGTYSFVVTDAAGCVFTDTFTVNQISSTLQLHAMQSWKLFPNPNDGNFTVEGEIESDNELIIRVLSILGEEKYISLAVPLHEFNNGFNVVTENLPPGIYFLQLWASGKITGCRTFTVAGR